MRRFLRDKELRIMDFPDEHNEFSESTFGYTAWHCRLSAVYRTII